MDLHRFELAGEDVVLAPLHCGQEMKHSRTRIWFEGEFAIEERHWACGACPTTATLEVREHAPRPAEKVGA